MLVGYLTVIWCSLILGKFLSNIFKKFNPNVTCLLHKLACKKKLYPLIFRKLNKRQDKKLKKLTRARGIKNNALSLNFS